MPETRYLSCWDGRRRLGGSGRRAAATLAKTVFRGGRQYPGRGPRRKPTGCSAPLDLRGRLSARGPRPPGSNVERHAGRGIDVVGDISGHRRDADSVALDEPRIGGAGRRDRGHPARAAAGHQVAQRRAAGRSQGCRHPGRNHLGRPAVAGHRRRRRQRQDARDRPGRDRRRRDELEGGFRTGR